MQPPHPPAPFGYYPPTPPPNPRPAGTPWWVWLLIALGVLTVGGFAGCGACVYLAARTSEPRGVVFRAGGNRCAMRVKYVDDTGALQEGEARANDWESDERRFWKSKEHRAFKSGDRVKLEVWNFNCSAPRPPTCELLKDGERFGTRESFARSRSAVCEGTVP